MLEQGENERPEPYSVEAEQAVLASILHSAKSMVQGLELLATEDFYRDNHQAIFDAIAELHKQGIPADRVTLPNQLRIAGTYEESGGEEYLETLYGKAWTAGLLESYAWIVKDYAMRRQLLKLSLELSAGVWDMNTRPATTMTRIMEATAQYGVSGEDRPQKIGDLIPTYYDTLATVRDGMEKLTWRTGLPTMDAEWDMGIPALVVVKARRGSGKTHIMVDWAWRCATHGRAVVLFSLEMPTRRMLQRVIARAGWINSRIVTKPHPDDWENVLYACDQAKGLPIYISGGRGTTTARMRTLIDSLSAKGENIGMIGIDYAELIGCTSRNSREQELMGIATDLQSMADRAQATVVLLSQTNKEGGERYSEGIGNAADLLLHWERPIDNGTLTAEKNRLAGGFSCPVKLDCRFSELQELTERPSEEER